MTIASLMTLTFIPGRSQVRFKLDYVLICNISDNIYAITFKLGVTTSRLMDALYAHAHFDDLELDARSQSVGKLKKSALNSQLSKQ